MLTPDYPIGTERLLLRPFDPQADVDAVHAYAGDPDVCRYIPWPPRTRDEVADWLTTRTHTTITAESDGIGLAAVTRDTGELVGDVVIFYRSAEHKTVEIGYVLNPAYRGRGYATEAARELLRLAFDEMGMHRAIARTDARNTASAAVLTRLGMRREAYLRENEWFKGEWTDEIDFAMLESEWRASGQR